MFDPELERFVDRSDAGRTLAAQLANMSLIKPVVYALPRGGVPVALEISRALNAPLDLILVRKIGAPGSPELALGAIVDGDNPQMIINEHVWRHSNADEDYLEATRSRELKELERRRSRYLGTHTQISPKERTAILVDDGIATGATMKAAMLALKQMGASDVIIAVPVAPKSAIPEFEALGSTVVCSNPIRRFLGVGAYFKDFHQLSDEEISDILEQAWE